MEKVVPKQPQAWNSETVSTVIYGEISAEISAAELAQDLRRNYIAHWCSWSSVETGGWEKLFQNLIAVDIGNKDDFKISRRYK